MFTVVFTNVLTMLLFLSFGFVLVKARKGESSHAKSFSGFLIYVCSPAMIISAFQSMDYSLDNLQKIGVFFLVTLTVQLLFFLALYALLRKKFDNAKYRILTAGALFGNVGFFGMPMVTALFPNESVVACYSTMFTTSMNFLVFTVGVFLITNDRRYISPKTALLNPTTLSVLAALPLYLLQIHFPAQLNNTVALLGKMTTPLCMLFTRSFAYVVCLLKLLVFPLFAFLCVFFLPFFDTTFKVSLLVLSAAPSAAVILSLSELHECEQELSANVTLLTTLLSIVTVPLILLIV